MPPSTATQHESLLLTGDIMLGRGIDQILPRPSSPAIHEAAAVRATDYVELAAAANGPVPARRDIDYPWGDARAAFHPTRASARIINLETSITTSDTFERKGINYRMHPDNIGCLAAMHIDCCVLANNHVLDWGRDGLLETLEVLERAGIRYCGAGRNADAAARPAVIRLASGRQLLVFALACADSGVPPHWAAGESHPGVHRLEKPDADAAHLLLERIAAWRSLADMVLVSIHWGSNWGYRIEAAYRRFAHALLDSEAVDIVHGHSSHHPRAVEFRGQRPVLYGCGDLINDYEGISGYADYRSDLVALYRVAFNTDTHHTSCIDMLPFRLRQLRLHTPAAEEFGWLFERMREQCRAFGTVVSAGADGPIRLTPQTDLA